MGTDDALTFYPNFLFYSNFGSFYFFTRLLTNLSSHSSQVILSCWFAFFSVPSANTHNLNEFVEWRLFKSDWKCEKKKKKNINIEIEKFVWRETCEEKEKKRCKHGTKQSGAVFGDICPTVRSKSSQICWYNVQKVA